MWHGARGHLESEFIGAIRIELNILIEKAKQIWAKGRKDIRNAGWRDHCVLGVTQVNDEFSFIIEVKIARLDWFIYFSPILILHSVFLVSCTSLAFLLVLASLMKVCLFPPTCKFLMPFPLPPSLSLLSCGVFWLLKCGCWSHVCPEFTLPRKVIWREGSTSL